MTAVLLSQTDPVRLMQSPNAHMAAHGSVLRRSGATPNATIQLQFSATAAMTAKAPAPKRTRRLRRGRGSPEGLAQGSPGRCRAIHCRLHVQLRLPILIVVQLCRERLGAPVHASAKRCSVYNRCLSVSSCGLLQRKHRTSCQEMPRHQPWSERYRRPCGKLLPSAPSD